MVHHGVLKFCVHAYLLLMLVLGARRLWREWWCTCQAFIVHVFCTLGTPRGALKAADVEACVGGTGCRRKGKFVVDLRKLAAADLVGVMHHHVHTAVRWRSPPVGFVFRDRMCHSCALLRFGSSRRQLQAYFLPCSFRVLGLTGGTQQGPLLSTVREGVGTRCSVPAVCEPSGPSLARGRLLHPSSARVDGCGHGGWCDLDRRMFSRVYNVAAVRVPADECGILVKRLKGHLLNWSRIKNVLRVPGEVRQGFLPSTEGCPVRSREESEEGKAFSVRVVDVNHPEPRVVTENALGQCGVVARETRLLLLHEKYSDRPASELPAAVQDLIQGDGRQEAGSLVQCELIISYDYWAVNEVLYQLLPTGMPVPSAFETVGHIAHLNLGSEHLPYRHVIAQVVLDKNWPKIRSVVNKLNAIQNTYRTMQLEVLAGDSALVTTIVEHGLLFHLDLSLVYWNTRLASERQRLVQQFESTDVVCDVFAGVGPITIAAAKKVRKVLANDLNAVAVTYLAKNIACNKVAEKVEMFNLDGREFIRKVYEGDGPDYCTQVVMNLPADAAEFLDAFQGVIKGGRHPLPVIHVYGFSKAAIPEVEFMQRVASILGESPGQSKTHRVRLVAPGKWMLCLSFQLPQRFAIAESAWVSS